MKLVIEATLSPGDHGRKPHISLMSAVEQHVAKFFHVMEELKRLPMWQEAHGVKQGRTKVWDGIKTSNRFEALPNKKSKMRAVPWDEEMTPDDTYSEWTVLDEYDIADVRRQTQEIWLRSAIEENKKIASTLRIEFDSDEWRAKMYNWRKYVTGPNPKQYRRTLPSRVLRLLRVKMSGMAQGLFSFDLNVNWPKNTEMKTRSEFSLEMPQVKQMLDMLGQEDPNVNWLGVVSEIGFFFGHLMTGGLTFTNMTLCFAHLLKNLPLTGLTEQMTRYLNVANAQNGETAMQVLGTALAGVIGIASVWGFSSLPHDRDTDLFIQRFAALGRCINSMEKVSDVTTKLTKVVMDYVKKVCLGYSSEEEAAWKEVNEFCDEVFELNTPDWAERCKDQAMGVRVSALTGKADRMAKMLDSLRAPQVETQRFRQATLFLSRVAAHQMSVGQADLKARVPPTLLHVFGDSGVGKSSALNYLCARVLTALGSTDPADMTNLVYTRHPGSEFYDGFQQGTKICIVDDFGALRDSEVRPSPEPYEAVRMMNSVPYRPNMAHLIDKAKATFECPLVIWTSNRPTFKFPSLTNPEAVVNRVQLKFKQFVDPEYEREVRISANEVLRSVDKEAVQKAIDEQRLESHRMIYRFCQVDPVSGMVLQGKEAMTFDEFATVVVETLQRDQQRGRDVLAEHTAYFASLAGPAQVGPVVEDAEEELEAVVVDGYQVRTRSSRDLFDRLWARLGFTRDVHIDVQALVREGIMNADDDTIQQYGRAMANGTDRSSRLASARCVTCASGDVARVADLLVRGWAELLRGEPAQSLLLLEYMEGVKACTIEQCNRQDLDVNALTLTWRNRCAQIRGTVNAGLAWMERPAQTPLGRMLKSMFCATVYVVVFQAMLMGMFWLIEKSLNWMWPTKGYKKAQKKLKRQKKPETDTETDDEEHNEESYTAGAPRQHKHQNTEGYAAGSPRQREKQNTEQYAAGTIRQHGKQNTEAYAAGQPRGQRVTNTESGEAESLSDQNGREVLHKIMKNCYDLSTGASVTGPWRKLGTCTMVSGRCFITNRHIVGTFEQFVRLYKQVGNQEYIFPVERCTVVTLPSSHKFADRDVAMVECPTVVPVHVSLTKYFMTAEDYSRHEELARVALIGYCIGVHAGYLTEKTSDKVRCHHKNDFELREANGKVSRLRNFYTSGLETVPGDCGSLLVALDNRFSRKICGIHMAGFDQNDYTAVASALHAGVIGSLTAEMAVRMKHPTSLTNGDYEVADVPELVFENGRITVNGEIGQKFTLGGMAHTPVHRNYQTTISKSPVAEVFGPLKKKPARLAPFDDEYGQRVDPMTMAMKKAATPAICVNANHLQRASDAVENMICRLAEERDARTLTFEESVTGIVGDECYPPINRRSSPGYGWQKNGIGKTRWLGEEEYVLDNVELHAARNKALERLNEGMRVGAYWTDTLKDELRPLDRVEAGKTRLFSAGEMVFTLLMRQYFGGFAAHMMRNKIETECCVGVNVYGLDWTMIVQKLSKYGQHVVAARKNAANCDKQCELQNPRVIRFSNAAGAIGQLPVAGLLQSY